MKKFIDLLDGPIVSLVKLGGTEHEMEKWASRHNISIFEAMNSGDRDVREVALRSLVLSLLQRLESGE